MITLASDGLTPGPIGDRNAGRLALGVAEHVGGIAGEQVPHLRRQQRLVQLLLDLQRRRPLVKPQGGTQVLAQVRPRRDQQHARPVLGGGHGGGHRRGRAARHDDVDLAGHGQFARGLDDRRAGGFTAGDRRRTQDDHR